MSNCKEKVSMISRVYVSEISRATVREVYKDQVWNYLLIVDIKGRKIPLYFLKKSFGRGHVSILQGQGVPPTSMRVYGKRFMYYLPKMLKFNAYQRGLNLTEWQLELQTFQVKVQRFNHSGQLSLATKIILWLINFLMRDQLTVILA